jgi:hypothetical protein
MYKCIWMYTPWDIEEKKRSNDVIEVISDVIGRWL